MSVEDLRARARDGIARAHERTGSGTAPRLVLIRAGETVTVDGQPQRGPERRYVASQAMEGSYSAMDRSGGAITERDLKVTAVPPFTAEDSSETIEPSSTDRAEWAGRKYSVQATPRTGPSGEAILWTLQLRAGE